MLFAPLCPGLGVPCGVLEVAAEEGEAAPAASGEPECPVVFCPSLPSSRTVNDMYEGRAGWPRKMARDFAGRAAICAAGMAVLGEREHLLRNALGAAGMIEVAAIGFVGVDRYRHGVGR
jgi:hypothetical protein